MPIALPAALLSCLRNPAIAVGIPVTLGIGSGLVTRTSVKTWYKTVEKPPGEPPKWAFPVVWTSLYAMMGYASHLAVRALDRSPSPVARAAAHSAIVLYIAQLGLNMAWTPLFFGLHYTRLALVDIAALTGTVFAATYQLAKADRRAMWLLVPYCVWLSYASYLNAGVVYLNKDAGTRNGDGEARKDL